MEEKKIEIVLTVVATVFIVALVGTAAWWIGHQDTGSLPGDSDSETTTARTGIAGLFPTPDRSNEAEKTQMYGRVTLNGQPPSMERRALADGTAYGGVVRLNYSQEQKYAPLTVGAASTGGLIDMSGNYSIDDVYEGVPFTATVTLYLETGEEPLIQEMPGQHTLDGPTVRDFDLSA
ncbi:hypothetical protein [Methanocella arvoryzae]|uniref:Uncharacterized protein n=1 Tax=Methanocella arvoryzae (strain DSM 22066 / NBRC 105507 / MRE50) TaxID=351160 RepID=Q0W4S9_METAR|nr:hypothetical protein [Methanocella arvoryzae]CAJ36614.1 hypothetical protein RCIX1325 [Methanocella arvoryzae MRE50]